MQFQCPYCLQSYPWKEAEPGGEFTCGICHATFRLDAKGVPVTPPNAHPVGMLEPTAAVVTPGPEEYQRPLLVYIFNGLGIFSLLLTPILMAPAILAFATRDDLSFLLLAFTIPSYALFNFAIAKVLSCLSVSAYQHVKQTELLQKICESDVKRR